MFGPSIAAIVETVVAGVVVAAVGAIWRMLSKFIAEQRKVNETNARFQESMQQAEIMRYFRIVVEQGHPLSPEELGHLEATYAAYHAQGFNGVGTVMYERIIKNVKIVTTIEEGT